MYDNSSAPTDKSCHVFDPAGGGLKGPDQFDASLFTSGSCVAYGQCLQIYTGHGFTWYMRRPQFGSKQGIYQVGTTASDLYFVLGDLRKDICLEINKKLGITNPSGNPPVNSGTIYENAIGFAGNYPVPGNVIGVSQQYTSGCVSDGASVLGRFFYYHTLIAR